MISSIAFTSSVGVWMCVVVQTIKTFISCYTWGSNVVLQVKL